MRYVVVFFWCWYLSPVRAQTPVLRGRVLDAETQQPVPHAQVGVGDNQIGTIANLDGRFSLSVPPRYAQSELEIVALGYKKHRQPLPSLPGPEVQVLLRPQPAALGEVTISGSVLGLVREAVARIPLNYPTRPTRLEGFFRESDNELVSKPTANGAPADSIRQDTTRANGPYRYLGEATLTVFKAPYTQSKDNGDVVIRQSRKVDLRPATSLSRQNWYAGPFIPHRFDFVHNRLDFINEADFRDYDYKIADLTTYQDRPVYVIAFGPKPGNTRADFAGRLYLDQDSYAFLAAEWHRTPAGLQREMIAIDLTERVYRVDYQQFAGRWHLKSVWYNTRAKTALNDTHLRHLSEFLTTAIDTAAGPTPGYVERAQFRDVFLDNKVRYDSAFWQNQTTLLPPEQLRAALRDKARQQQAEQLFAPKEPAALSPEKRLLAGLLDRLRFGNAVGLLPVTATAADVALAFAPANSSFRADGARRTPATSLAGWYGSRTQFDLTRRLGVFYLNRQVFGRFQGKGWELGATYEINLRPRHRPILARVGFGYLRQRVRYDFGTFVNADRDLSLGGKSLKAKTLAVAVQARTDGWLPRVGLGLELSHRFEVVADYGYLLPVSTRPEVRLKEKSGFFFNRHDTDTGLSVEALQVNGQQAPPPWRLDRSVLTVGILYRLR